MMCLEGGHMMSLAGGHMMCLTGGHILEFLYHVTSLPY